ncbi:hypothetical protein KP509_35G001400 [Ceratopteris richardii]|uniref:Leucine-rich repeat-containing N-terminal plant-type domain-containing protein n=1 Tax=Ceratopteris richardii TaxID=49495 RepID=A0A8T2QCN4_CERRI|nr:hypothetical protein KP509_35G001400 [Ceratopteris richardii]
MGRLALFSTMIMLLLRCLSGVMIQASDVSALMAFKRGISRDIHNILGSWDPSLATPLGWFHVTCDAAGRVIRLFVFQTR